MRLELHINTDGAAFGGDDEDEGTAQREVARILRAEADRIEAAATGGYQGHELLFGGFTIDTPVRLRDVNGNRVGFWLYTDNPSNVSV